MTYLNDKQIAQLLKAINAKRVNSDSRGFKNLEAYDVRAHLSRIFGFGRWSQTVDRMEQIYESVTQDDKGHDRVSVAYRAQVTLTVCAPDGTPLATYSEWAMGDAKNFPLTQHGEAHDFAIKTAESQGLKRCAVNLGSQFGLSLYQKGSLAEIVGKTLIHEDGPATPTASVDEHVEAVPPEDTAPDPADEPRSTNGKSAPQTPEKAQEIRDALIDGPPQGAQPRAWLQGLMRDATTARVLQAKVPNAEGKPVALKVLLEAELKFRSAA